MASKFRLDVTVQENANGAISQIQPLKKSPAMILENLGRYFSALGMGRVGTSTRVVMTAVSATGTVIGTALVAGDTVTVGATIFTGTDTPTLSTDFDTSSGVQATIVASLAAAINANTTTSKYISASAPTATMTLTSLVAGVIGNAIYLANSAHATVTAFSGGSEDTPVTLAHGS